MIGASYGVQCIAETASDDMQHTATADNLQAGARAHALEWALGAYAHGVGQGRQLERWYAAVSMVEQARLNDERIWATAVLPEMRGVRHVESTEYRGIVAQFDWDVMTAMRVIQCESGGDPNAYNPSGAYGLMQLMDVPLYDPAANIAYGYGMYSGWGDSSQARGWQPWEASRHCWG